METLSLPPSSHKFLDFDDYAFASKSLHHENEKLKKLNVEQEFSSACTNPQELLTIADEIFLDFDDFAFASRSFHHDFTFKIKIDNNNAKHEEFNFNFTFVIPHEPLVTADEIFHDGKIRPLFRDLMVGDSIEMCKKKNNLMGFSKMLRCQHDLQHRSYNNGNDAFIFLHPPGPAKKTHDVVKNAKRKTTSLSSPHEKLYKMNRKRTESEKRRSFLPYKQQLFGFFTNMNVFNKNIHPF